MVQKHHTISPPLRFKNGAETFSPAYKSEWAYVPVQMRLAEPQ